MHDNLRIDGERLWSRLAQLGAKGALAGGGVSRLALSDADKEGRDLVVGWMKELGLSVSVDAVGNVFGTRAGLEDGAPVVMGSHIDTVATGGLFDGNLGVLGGLEVISTLNDAGLVTKRPLAVAFFTNEEGSRFQPDMLGSLAYVGGLGLNEALATKAIDGEKLGDALTRIGYAGPQPVANPKAHAYVELHVEQGPVLEEEGFTVGAVEGVQGIFWTEFTIAGQSNHAGTTPMRLRHDAGLVAAEIAVYARKLAVEIGGDQVATVGALTLSPNLVNVVANQALLTVDLRNTDSARLHEAERKLFAFADEAARKEGVELTRRTLAHFEPVAFNTTLVSRVAAIAKDLGFKVKRMPSGAGHDAQMMARICPACMIFVPSVKGISHNIKEYTSPEDVSAGANVLLNLILELAS